MPEPLVFLLQGFVVLSVAAVLLSALAWLTRTVLAWVLRRFGIPANADRPPPTEEELAELQNLLEEDRRMFDWGPTSTDPAEQLLYKRHQFGDRR